MYDIAFILTISKIIIAVGVCDIVFGCLKHAGCLPSFDTGEETHTSPISMIYFGAILMNIGTYILIGSDFLGVHVMW
jgi:hypothetical protein